jgi:TolA-binding protein
MKYVTYVDKSRIKEAFMTGLMKSLCVSMALMIAVGVSSCSADKTAELFETAQFEELQNNNEHARQLYEEIVQKYPDSDVARKAKERLTALDEENK